MSGSVAHSDNAAEEAAAQAVLLGTKLHVPAVGAHLLERPGLLEALSAGRTRRLTLLSAPVGWGKTTLLAQWACSNVECQGFSWLSLDRSDNDPVWFWMYVVAALQKISPAIGVRAVELLVMGADPIQVVLPTLMNDLDSFAEPMVLVLDDYHLVLNRAVHEQLAFVIDRMPANMHVVVATRSDPMLPLARLRACGDLTEMRSDDLRFSSEEAGRLLSDVLALDVAQADIELLHRRTEGWAAGLYLAALSVAGRADAAGFLRTFAGDNRHIVDYLMTEVLDGQPPHLRGFLLRTSVLDRLNGPLCDAVLQTCGSAAVLERAERENLFVVPMDASRRWYRYHHLFGELLRAELSRSEPDLVNILHRRAAAWFEGEGLIDEAVRHLVAAGDVAGSADLIAADWINEFNNGGLSTVSGWLDLLPERTIRQDPRLSVARAWIALNVGRFDDARYWIHVVENESAADTADDPGIGAQLVVLHEVHAFKTGDVTGALEAACRAKTLDFKNAQQARSAACSIYGSALYFSGSIGEAQAAFRDAAQLAEKLGDRRRGIYSLGYLSLIAAESGQLAEAEHQIRRATGIATNLASGEHFVNAIVSLAAAMILDGRGQKAAAADAAERAVSLARAGAGFLELAKALVVRAAIAEDLGDHQTVTASRMEADTLLRRCADADIARTMLTSSPRSACVAARPRNRSDAVVEELTAKEHEVLRLLATRLSRREIGQRLYVSINTVKSHQRGLYRKLGVENRAVAVKRGHELGLL
ncbi:helix-turn-helix transcriptional regulator [Mycobacterium sp. ACS1612]|uniref:LuxR C-terminal-related transcriptional regulator n=1 Tax=Mycobacterium sp. ACS1612 TaxID=1834117 RepID=UPI000800AC07|nr:LuxR C-terminal-related transcriptional regulator [Mycobacterium sp. ACS1612]OBF36116.1 helix-turn-helix transcriptional regulator [Mycobacterium sp. ACS1612]